MRRAKPGRMPAGDALTRSRRASAAESDLTTGRHCRTARLTRGAGGEQRDTSLVRGAQARRDRWGDTQEGGEEARRRTRDRGGQRPARESGPKGLEEAQRDEDRP